MDYTEPPVDLDEVRLYRLSRVREKLAAQDFAGALLFDPLNVRYATDCTNMQIWAMHFEMRCALVMTDGPVILFDYADLPHLAEGLPTIDEHRVHKAFYFFAAGQHGEAKAGEFAREIADVVREHGGGNRRLAVDRLASLGVDALRNEGLEIHDAYPVTEVARSIKSAGEIALIRHSIDVCQQGMAAMREALRPGITENALWAKLHEVNISNGGEWIEGRLLSSGPRTNPWFYECSMRVIEEGDLVSFDTDLVGPYGYCADMSRAWICGDSATDEQKRIYRLAYEEIQHNTAALEPGISFREYSRRAWPIPEEFVKNSYDCIIHGVGLVDEWPAIPSWYDFEAYGYDGTIEPGMVISVESYIGSEGGREGVKLEEMVLITEGGTTPLSTYPMEHDLLRD